MSSLGKFIALVEAGVPVSQSLKLSPLPEGEISNLVLESVELGAPLSKVGAALVDFEIELSRFEGELEQANAVPLATRKLLLWLPAFSILLGQFSGFQTIPALFTPVGLIAGLLAGSLILLGIRWSGRMLLPLRQKRSHPAMGLMRLSLAIQSGQPLRAGAPALGSEAAELIELSRTSGAPLGRLIESEIQLTSARAIQQIISQARQLSISLLVPMAVTVLPAFLILTVVPMFIGIGF